MNVKTEEPEQDAANELAIQEQINLMRNFGEYSIFPLFKLFQIMISLKEL